MIKLTRVPALALLAASPAFAETTHRERVAAFASVTMMAVLAEEKCPGLKRSEPATRRLEETLGLDGRDAPQVTADAADMAPALHQALHDMGAAKWCAAAWKLFGPEGTQLPGILTREGPE